MVHALDAIKTLGTARVEGVADGVLQGERYHERGLVLLSGTALDAIKTLELARVEGYREVPFKRELIHLSSVVVNAMKTLGFGRG